jgi:aminoglycoside phosphotransferase (APT) family kinase protein
MNAGAAAAFEALADAALMADMLDRWCETRGKAAAGPWRREYARHHPGEEPWSVSLFQGAGQNLLRVDTLSQAGAADLVHPRLGPLRIVEFPHDAALPGLGEVVAMLERVQVVRYRPGKRCTLRGFADGEERFVKVVQGGERLYRDAQVLWAGRQAGAIGFAVAEPHAWHAPTASFWQGVVPGRPVTPEVFGPDAQRFAHRLGAALGELARSKLAPSQHCPAEAQLRRTSRALARTALALPSLGHRLGQVRVELERRHGALAPRPPVPIHGAPHVHQWLLDGSQLGLIDFDRFALGDPEFDLATFVAELDTERAMQQPVAAVEAAWVEGFESIGPRMDSSLAWLYRVHKRLSKVTRTAWAIRPDAARRADQHLQTVEAMLSGA